MTILMILETALEKETGRGSSNKLEAALPRRRPELAVQYRTIKRASFRALRSLVFFFFRLWLRKIIGAENLPTIGPAIIASNHVSHFDWAIIGSVLRKQVVFVAAHELKEKLIIRWLMRFNTLVYVDREKPGIRYFREIIRHLKGGKIIVTYPEGTRSKTGKRQPAKLGFIKLAFITKVPIVPIAMRGTYRILPPHHRIPRLRKCTITVGGPILPTFDFPLFKDLAIYQTDSRKLGAPLLQEMAERVMDEIGRLAGPEWENPNLRYRNSGTSGRSFPHFRIYGDKIAAFFDVDRTLIPFRSQQAFGAFCFRKQILPIAETLLILMWYPLSKLGFIKDSLESRKCLYRFLTSRAVEEWDKIFDEFHEFVVKPRVPQYVQEIIKGHIRNRHYVILVSGTLVQIAERLKRYLNATHVIATKVESNGSYYTGEIVGPIIEGFHKAIAVEEFAQRNCIDLRRSYAYGDSFNDIRILSKVGQPVVVNPDLRLRIYAKRKGWPVLRTC